MGFLIALGVAYYSNTFPFNKPKRKYHLPDEVEIGKRIDALNLDKYAKVVVPDCYKHCGNTQPSPDGTICLNCGSSIVSKND